MTPRLAWLWASTAIVLVSVTFLGGFTAWSRYNGSRAIEVSLAQDRVSGGLVHISGGVAVPGIYPFAPDDSIGALIRAAGGLTAQASPDQVRLDIPVSDIMHEPQRIDINRAPMWLLKALPGIGQTLATRIVEYREQNGPFRHTSELTRVAGIGKETYEKIKDLITVTDR